MAELTAYLEKVARFNDLTEEESSRAFQIMMMGGATPAQMAAFLMALRMKGETVEEVTGGARAMRAKCGTLNAPEGALDTCGTGGDASGSLNISTTVAFVVAGCGVPVAKHGNRAISSKSGSSDVLRALGVNIDADKETMEQALRESNICFLMAPKFHTAMRHVAPVRAELAVRTIFNLLGPLANPAKTKLQLLGVYDVGFIEPMAHVLGRLGTTRAWVVHGEGGIDEMTTTGTSHVAELKDGKVTRFTVNPEDVGLERVNMDAISGGDVRYNAEELRKLLSNQGSDAYRDIVLLNAGASLVVANKAEGLVDGIAMARESLQSGAALAALQSLVSITSADR